MVTTHHGKEALKVASSHEALEEKYNKFFTPAAGALTGSEQCQAAFRIYTTVDYSVPVYHSSNTLDIPPVHA